MGLNPSRRRTIALVTLIACALVACGARTQTAPVEGVLPVGPDAGDLDLSSFYRWDEAMPDSPGALLRTEALEGQPELPAAGETTRLLYSSTDWRWNSGQVAVSGTLFLPEGAPPSGGWPLLAWAHGTLGISDACAPSWTGFRDRDASYINRWLEQGYAVVATDYQGLGGPGPHPYSQWQAEGRSVLDSIRAAFQARPALLSGEAFLAGQSQGGGAALGAATLSGDYAPELAILGAVITAPNSTFPDGPVSLPPRGSNTVFLTLATGGLRDDAPDIEDILTPEGLDLLDVARQACTRDIVMRARELEVASPLDLLTVSPEALNEMRLPTTDQPLQPIGFPLMLATGQADHTIPPMHQYAVASALCVSDNAVSWHVYDGMGHDGVMHRSLEDAFAFARARRAGDPPASSCDSLQPPGPPGERDPDALFNDD